MRNIAPLSCVALAARPISCSFRAAEMAIKSTVGALCCRWKFILALASVTLLLTNPASAVETYRLECTMDKYSPGELYTEKFLRNFIPENLVIDHTSNEYIQIFYPSLSRQFLGEGYRENSKKFSMRFNIPDAQQANVYFTLDYFKESKKIYISADGGAAYRDPGDASGTCKFPVFTKHDVEPGASDSRVCTMSTGYGDWLTSKSFQDWVEEAHKRNLSLVDCETLLTVKQRTQDSAFGRAPDNQVCNIATEDGNWVTSSAFLDWIEEAHRRNLSLDDCERVLRAN